MNIKENGGTNFELAYETAIELFTNLFNSSKDFISQNKDYDNRIIMLTDAAPNLSADHHSLIHLVKKNSESLINEDKRIYTTLSILYTNKHFIYDLYDLYDLLYYVLFVIFVCNLVLLRLD